MRPEEKTEDLADLIRSETRMDWKLIEKALPKMPTGDLIELMTRLGLYVNRKFALEVAKREDAVFHLRKFMQDGGHWSNYASNSGWAPIHAIHLLALVKSPEALELLMDIVRYKAEDLDDWLTEDVPALFVAFGEGAINALKEFVSDETLDAYVRGGVTRALAALAKKFPEREPDVKMHLVKLLNSTGDETFASLIVDDIASFHDPSVLPDVHRAFEEEKIDEPFMTESDIVEMINGLHPKIDKLDFERDTREPIEHFSRESIVRLHSIQLENEKSEKEVDEKDSETKDEKFADTEPAPKRIGRNDPCPCGSGKKFKKCCMWGGGGSAAAA